MSIKIVTPNVIRQALNWMGAPKPRYFVDWSPALTSLANTSIQQVWLRFDRYKLHQWLKTTPHAETYPRTTAVVAALQDCFCDDIQVICANYPDGLAEIEVSLLLVVSNDQMQ